MAASPKSWKDYIWLLWFSLQPFVILMVDMVEFYPKWLYSTPDSPLYFLQQTRDNYIETYNDPLFQWTPETGHDNWIHLCLLIEMVFTLPTVFYAIYRLLPFRRAGTTGADELLFLVYALETAFTTFMVIYDVQYWDNAVYSAELKQTFVFKLLAPWFVFPALMAVDMYTRILARFRAADAAVAGKKRQ